MASLPESEQPAPSNGFTITADELMEQCDISVSKDWKLHVDRITNATDCRVHRREVCENITFAAGQLDLSLTMAAPGARVNPNRVVLVTCDSFRNAGHLELVLQTSEIATCPDCARAVLALGVGLINRSDGDVHGKGDLSRHEWVSFETLDSDFVGRMTLSSGRRISRMKIMNNTCSDAHHTCGGTDPSGEMVFIGSLDFDGKTNPPDAARMVITRTGGINTTMDGTPLVVRDMTDHERGVLSEVFMRMYDRAVCGKRAWLLAEGTLEDGWDSLTKAAGR